MLASATAVGGRPRGLESDDQALVAAVRAGDDRAFEALYAHYHRRIAAYIYGMVHDHGRAEDLTQDVFMSALRRMRQTDRPLVLKPWLYEIAKNACIDQFRRSRRAEEVSYDADEGLGAADYGRLVSTGSAPDVAVDTKQQLDHLRGAFGGLSDTHHEILVMRELEGLSYRQIGEKLGMTRPSVESTLFRARRRLTEEYEELVTGKRCVRIQAIIAMADRKALGARDQRRMARHVSHCQACRRQARMAGVDIAAATAPAGAKIAALVPLPAFLRRRWGGEDGPAAMGSQSSATLAQWSANIAGSLDPAIAGWSKAAVAAVAVAVAGVGAGTASVEPIERAVLPAAPVLVQERDGARAAAGRQLPGTMGGRADELDRGRGLTGGGLLGGALVGDRDRGGGTGGGRRDGGSPDGVSGARSGPAAGLSPSVPAAPGVQGSAEQLTGALPGDGSDDLSPAGSEDHGDSGLSDRLHPLELRPSAPGTSPPSASQPAMSAPDTGADGGASAPSAPDVEGTAPGTTTRAVPAAASVAPTQAVTPAISTATGEVAGLAAAG